MNKRVSVESYGHHGVDVVVMSKNKGKHRKNCLCFNGCMHFKPDTKNNCPIAKALFKNCVKYHVTTPVWECPNYAVDTE